MKQEKERTFGDLHRRGVIQMRRYAPGLGQKDKQGFIWLITTEEVNADNAEGLELYPHIGCRMMLEYEAVKDTNILTEADCSEMARTLEVVDKYLITENDPLNEPLVETMRRMNSERKPLSDLVYYTIEGEFEEVLTHLGIKFNREEGDVSILHSIPQEIRERVVECLVELDKDFERFDELKKEAEEVGIFPKDCKVLPDSVKVKGIPKKTSFDNYSLTRGQVLLLNEYLRTQIKRKREAEIRKREVIGDRGQISVALTSNIAKPKDPDLFSELEKEEYNKALSIDDNGEGVEIKLERHGKTFYLPNRQQKIIWALSHLLSQDQNDEEFKSLVENVTRSLTIKGAPKFQSRRLNLRNFIKEYHLGTDPKKITLKDVDNLRRELWELHSTKQILFIKTNTDEWTLTQPLIIITQDLTRRGRGEKGTDADGVEIQYSNLFLYKMLNDYFPYSKRLFEIWGRRGNGTENELFPIVLADFAKQYQHYRQTRMNGKKKMRRADFATDEEYLEAKRSYSPEYKQTLSLLMSKTPYDFSNDKYKKQSKHNFINKLKKTLDTLKDDLHLIGEYKFYNNSQGYPSISAPFNESYLIENETKTKKISE